MSAPIPASTSNFDGFEPGGLWSLYEMLRIFAHTYIELGRKIEEASTLIHLVDAAQREGLPADQSKMNLSERMQLQNILQEMSNLCSEIQLPVAQALISDAMRDTPKTSRELDLLAKAVMAELKSKLFLYVPSERSSFVEKSSIELSVIATNFPKAVEEILLACRCYAFGLGTAAVFHAMRATEIGVRVMAQALNVRFSYPIELAEWGKIVAEIEPKIHELREGARSAQKDKDVKFYSEAASQFRHFNNGWRVRVSHARENYSDDEARKVLDHVKPFFVTLAERLSEAPQS